MFATKDMFLTRMANVLTTMNANKQKILAQITQDAKIMKGRSNAFVTLASSKLKMTMDQTCVTTSMNVQMGVHCVMFPLTVRIPADHTHVIVMMVSRKLKWLSIMIIHTVKSVKI